MESEEFCSEYEALRKENESARIDFMRQLGILHGLQIADPRIQEQEVSVKKPRLYRKKVPDLQPVRKSPRLAARAVKLTENVEKLTENVEKLTENAKKDNIKEPIKSPISRKFLPEPERMTRTHADDTEPSLEYLLPYLKEECTSVNIKKSLDCFKASLKEMTLLPEHVRRVGITKTYSLVIHPSESKLLVIAGDDQGNLGFWDVEEPLKEVEIYRPLQDSVRCLSLCAYNPVKLYATAFNGVVRNCDLEKMQFNDVYVVKKQDHTVYHEQISPNTLLVAHGCGDVGLVDTRATKKPFQWFKCHTRSVRTIHQHPVLEYEFATASGTGEACIWDIRKHARQKPLLLLPHPKGLKSAFFSPEGSMLLTTCNDDRIRMYTSDRNHLLMSKTHNVRTGRWLRPLQAMWHPRRGDVFIVGSMNKPRQVDICGIHGLTIHSLMSANMKTVLSNCQFHVSRSIIAGANSGGYVHVFRGPEEL